MRAFIAGIILIATASSTVAQERGYLQGAGGATFMARTSGVFGGEAGIHLTRDFVVFGQAGRMIDVLPREVQDDIDDAAAQLESFTGREWLFDARVRATYAGGGVRYFFQTRSRVRPYVTGGVGLVTYTGSLRERELGDVLDLAISLDVVESDEVKGTEVAYEAGGGIVVPRGRMQIDAGYRLMNVRGVNISRLVGGVGFRF